MSQYFQKILEHPVAFLLACAGVALVLRAAGTHEALRILLRFFELVFQRLCREFTKPNAERTAIESIDFCLVLFFGVIALLATICLLLPSGIAQAVGLGNHIQDASIRCFRQSTVLFLASGIASGTLVLMAEKDSAVRLLLRRCLGGSRCPDPQHQKTNDQQPPTTPPTVQ